MEHNLAASMFAGTPEHQHCIVSPYFHLPLIIKVGNIYSGGIYAQLE
jgi:hypothetical protein